MRIDKKMTIETHQAKKNKQTTVLSRTFTKLYETVPHYYLSLI